MSALKVLIRAVDFPSDYNNARVHAQMENRITVNGEQRQFEAGTTLREVIGALGLDPERVAVELNRKIVKKDLWTTTPIESGAEIEIAQFVGGG
jgi:thiamine biosynthesis protein ThiS